MKTILSATAMAIAVSSPVVADEIWDSELIGRVIYEVDIEDLAVFSFVSVISGARANLYIPELPSTLDDRGSYEAYWIDPTDGGDCMADLTGADGLISSTWGAAVVSFDKRDFPSAFDVQFGNCFGGMIFSTVAVPTTD